MKKKIIAITITGLTIVCLILAACSNENKASGTLNLHTWGEPPHTEAFSGRGWGYYYDGVSMSFRLENGIIVEVEFDLSGESIGIVGHVPDRIRPLILDTNSFNFPPNVVAGATRTIEAIITIGTEALLTIDGVEEGDIEWQWKPIEGDRGGWFTRPFPGQLH